MLVAAWSSFTRDGLSFSHVLLIVHGGSAPPCDDMLSQHHLNQSGTSGPLLSIVQCAAERSRTRSRPAQPLFGQPWRLTHLSRAGQRESDSR